MVTSEELTVDAKVLIELVKVLVLPREVLTEVKVLVKLVLVLPRVVLTVAKVLLTETTLVERLDTEEDVARVGARVASNPTVLLTPLSVELTLEMLVDTVLLTVEIVRDKVLLAVDKAELSEVSDDLAREISDTKPVEVACSNVFKEPSAV